MLSVWDFLEWWFAARVLSSSTPGLTTTESPIFMGVDQRRFSIKKMGHTVYVTPSILSCSYNPCSSGWPIQRIDEGLPRCMKGLSTKKSSSGSPCSTSPTALSPWNNFSAIELIIGVTTVAFRCFKTSISGFFDRNTCKDLALARPGRLFEGNKEIGSPRKARIRGTRSILTCASRKSIKFPSTYACYHNPFLNHEVFG